VLTYLLQRSWAANDILKVSISFTGQSRRLANEVSATSATPDLLCFG
jgi:hypothetical protein